MLSFASKVAEQRHGEFYMILPERLALKSSDGGALLLTDAQREKRLKKRRYAKAQRKRNR